MVSKNKHNVTVHDEELDIAYMRGYKRSVASTVIYYGIVGLTFGLILVVFHWFPRWYYKLKFRDSSLREAAYVYVKENDKTVSLCKVQHLALGKNGLILPGEKTQRMIIFKFVRFFYNEDNGLFERINFQTDYSRQQIAESMRRGLNTESYYRHKDLFGPNIIDVPLKSVPRLLLDEVLHPFFIFQIYSIGLWCSEAYYYYAGAILLIATVSAFLTLRETRNNLIQLGKIARFTCPVTVLRNGQFENASSETLAPGDIVEIQTGLILPCDFTLLSGVVVLNESMLTGESIPVTKYPLSECAGDTLSVHPDVNKRCTMSGGTRVVKIQGKKDERILAMVTRTAWTTTKGQLVLSMLYPKETHFKFFQQSIKFLLVLCSIALVGFGVSVWRLHELGVTANEIVIRALDLITIVVPPALPMAQSVGQGFSIFRLKKRSIFCISPPRVSMGGKIEVFCFDKTGTLTEDGLDLLGVVPNYNKAFSPMVKDVDRLTGPLFLTLATCHTLAYIENAVSGDPLEEKIFFATKAHLDDNHPRYCAAIRFDRERNDLNVSDSVSFPISTQPLEQCREIGLVERFEFQSALQRMSVIIRGDGIDGNDMALVKGSPEKIKELSVADSIPSDFDTVLDQYTKKGYRVLACGYKQYNAPVGMSKDEIRSEVESGLHFLGFIIMENKIKKETPPALQILKNAMIRLIMVTGDNVLTAVSVSRECGLVDQEKIIFVSEVVRDGANSKPTIVWRDATCESNALAHRLDPVSLTVDGKTYDEEEFALAVTGDAWRILYEDMQKNGRGITFTRLLQKGAIYARMTPDQKQNLVEQLQESNLYVGMCGDGANDCGALKAAHVGISLSIAEASIAAPFTSTITNITCTHQLIREGRASLAVSFKLFQFIGMYSLIQFISVILLYMEGSVLGNWMYLYQDLFMIFPLVIFMGRTEPCSKLAVKRPSSRLISPAVIGSLFSHVALCAIFQTIVFVFVQRESWYIKYDADIITYICTSLFIYANFQYLIMCFIFSWGKPFLKAIYTNTLLFGCFIVTVATSFLILLLPTKDVWKFAQLLEVPVEWRVKLLILLAINATCSIGVEWLIIIAKNRKTMIKRKAKLEALKSANQINSFNNSTIQYA